ncbi:MAG TPA: polysaccharide biosynthesis/export family protein [Sphingomicrobium sp.]|nr:polysaccharide biosynthesis/export family protein [Sphingomicrobium sp.]
MRGLKATFTVLLLGLTPLLSGCLDSRGGPIPYNQQLSMPDEPKVEALGQGYKIAPLDTLSVKVFKSEDLTGDYDVDLAGNISLPLIGEVQAASLTTAELDERLTGRLGEKYLQNPDVAVAVKKSSSRVVTIDGAVREPGSVPVIQPISLMQAVAMAKGTTDDANPRRVAVFRTIGGQRQAAAFDLTSIRRGQTPDPTIYPGDIVVVDGSQLKQIQKQILSNLPILSVFRPF